MAAKTHKPGEVIADNGSEARHLRVVQALHKGIFDESFYIQPKWLAELQPIETGTEWRVDSHADDPAADWVSEHSLAYGVSEPVNVEAVA